MNTSPNIVRKQAEIPPRAFPGSAGWRSAGMRLFGAALLGASLLAVGCDDSQTPMQRGVTADDVTQETGEALDTAARLAEQEKNEFLLASRQEMEEIKADLEALKREAAAAQGEAKRKLDRQVAELDEKWNAADAKVAALRAETSEAWTRMQEEVLAALTDLKASYQEVRREMTRS